jgi:hypothetical protein
MHTTKAEDQHGRVGHETLHPKADGSDGDGSAVQRVDGGSSSSSSSDEGTSDDEGSVTSAEDIKDSVKQAAVCFSTFLRGLAEYV